MYVYVSQIRGDWTEAPPSLQWGKQRAQPAPPAPAPVSRGAFGQGSHTESIELKSVMRQA